MLRMGYSRNLLESIIGPFGFKLCKKSRFLTTLINCVSLTTFKTSGRLGGFQDSKY